MFSHGGHDGRSRAGMVVMTAGHVRPSGHDSVTSPWLCAVNTLVCLLRTTTTYCWCRVGCVGEFFVQDAVTTRKWWQWRRAEAESGKMPLILLAMSCRTEEMFAPIKKKRLGTRAAAAVACACRGCGM
eukprot:365580-Chlamydomonas_euryale.AAC.11